MSGRAPVNLLPKNEEEQTFYNRVIHWLLTTFRFLVITVELVVIVGFLSRFFLDSQNSDLTDELNQKKALITSYLPFENEFKAAQARLTIAKKYYDNQPFSEIVSIVTKNIGTNLQLASLQKKDATLEIRVQGTDEGAISTFVQRLKHENLLTNIHITTIENISESNIVTATIIGNTNVGNTKQ